jgi:SAM-dependent methyltransferase
MSTPDEAYIEWKSWDGDTFGKFTPGDAVYYLAEVGGTVDERSRVLEIGFGNGCFLGWARAAGAEIFGVEVNAHLNSRARQAFGCDTFFEDLNDARLTRHEGEFSHIVAFDVIEHIDVAHMPAVLVRIRDLLQPGGRFIARFPNGDSPFGRMIQHGDPTHVTTYGRHKLIYLARNADLRVLEIRAPALPLRGVGILSACKRAGVKLGRRLIERVLSILYFGGQRIALDSNYVAVLSRKSPA